MIPIRRALLSVSDKTGIAELGTALHRHGARLISTGGTRAALLEAGLPVTEISEITGNPEAFGGRMKTLSFQVESAILFHRDRDRAQAQALGIEPIDMVVCNLYPFEKYAAAGADEDTLVENIDIGGPTMIRAGAKNHSFVATVVDPLDYPAIIAELDTNAGALCPETRARLMRKAFNLTADYDASIACTMDERAGRHSRRLAFSDGMDLRYGENWHQTARFYRRRKTGASLHDLELLGGKELSFNNITDIQAAIEAAADIPASGCAIIKHGNPCGLANGDDPAAVFNAAWEGDPVSAFGSVIAFNSPVDEACAAFLQLDHPDKTQRKFVEVVLAPDFSDEALSLLRRHKALRIIRFDPALLQPEEAYRFSFGSLLEQGPDDRLCDRLETVTERQLEIDDPALLRFGLAAVKHVRSNAIVVARRKMSGELQLLGMGAGQPNRVVSVRLALDKCRENLEREFDGKPGSTEEFVRESLGQAVLFSDAFFPFADNIEVCAGHGIVAVVQPGGSMRDKQVIRRCNELKVAMVFTGVRHFKH